ncbi:MAG TPA: penicillin-binding protein 2 [Steroidobacteraceae bacterium]|nr:penicillin-binding protein 2 [Steroidobacteraceae bacterium]
MPRSVRIKDHWGEQRLFIGRTLFAAVASVVLLMIVGGRLFWLQVVRHDYYVDLSQGNRVRLEPLPPDRGLIYDRNGTVIAENTPAFQLELTPEEVADVPDTLQRLAGLGLIDADQVPALERLIRAGRKFEAVPLRLSLTDTDIATFAVRQFEFPGVEIQTRLARWYPFGPAGAHALGYVAAISEEDLQQINADEYAGSAVIGKIGLESSYEQRLHGAAGFRQVLVNAQGRRVDRLGSVAVRLDTRPSRAGNDLFVGLDMRVQRVAEESLAGRRGAVIAIDPTTGDVIALASLPSFDPNKFTRGISTREYVALRDDPDRPLFNRALRGTYPPGSTVKPLMALAGLEYGAIDPKATRFCHGYYMLPGSSRHYRDWKKEGHGSVDMRRAIAVSCDVYFYGLAELLGIERVHDAMVGLGFGRPTGIDIGGERPGLMPSEEWKRQTYKQAWFPGDTVIIGIGQGYMLATPLQLAHAVAIVAGRGRSFRPRLVTGVRDATTREVKTFAPVAEPPVELKDPSNWEVIIEGMEMVTEAGGTAAVAARGASYKIAGKTGTAQVFGLGQNEKYNASAVSERLRDHALFIAFAPADAPKLAVAVLVENGGHGSSAAAPIARRVFDAYLLGKYDAPPAAAAAVN